MHKNQKLCSPEPEESLRTSTKENDMSKSSVPYQELSISRSMSPWPVWGYLHFRVDKSLPSPLLEGGGLTLIHYWTQWYIFKFSWDHKQSQWLYIVVDSGCINSGDTHEDEGSDFRNPPMVAQSKSDSRDSDSSCDIQTSTIGRKQSTKQTPMLEDNWTDIRSLCAVIVWNA